ncbi:DUF349 domain-containing protein [Myroides sp. LJL119]
MQNQSHDNLQDKADGQNKDANLDQNQNSSQTIEQTTQCSNQPDNDNDNDNELPIVDYDTMDLQELTESLKKLINNYSTNQIKEEVELIKKTFQHKYEDIFEQKKDIFLQNNADASESDFDFKLPIKEVFDSAFNQYKSKRADQIKDLDAKFKANLQTRLALIEQLKELADNKSGNSVTVKQLDQIRQQWKNAGSVAKEKYEELWNNYQFHIERFYDLLTLDRETRDLDFKYNLEQKQRIIARAKELLNNPDVIMAFNELQALHRSWKEDTGPVDRELRNEIWQEFTDISKELYNKKEAFFDQLRISEKQNLNAKVAIISQIDESSKKDIRTHGQWQKEIRKVEQLRNEFFAIGKVPRQSTGQLWDLFKIAIKRFNASKNNFYKELKKEQQENYLKKVALIKLAQEHQHSTDFKASTPIMKNIQDQWKHIGHVPKKHSASLWEEFKVACNTYFERLHDLVDQEHQQELQAFLRKKEYLNLLKGFELSGDHKMDLAEIKNHMNNWKIIGKVPSSKRFVEAKFNKLLDTLFEKLDLSKREAESVKFSNRLDNLIQNNDTDKLYNEAVFLHRKIEEVSNDIQQLETNLAYIHNPSDSNPFVIEVKRNIAKAKEEQRILRDKLAQLRNLNN